MKYSIVLLLLVLAACQKADQPVPYTVPPVFESYLNRFLDEGAKRGQVFDLKKDGITIKITKLNSFDGYTNLETRTIEIDSSWNSANEFRKQWVLFHELGHLLLKRVHALYLLPNGEIGSLMWTAENNPDKCNIVMFKGTIRQKYYFDELFDPKTVSPDYSTPSSANTLPASAASQSLFRQDELNGTQLNGIWQKITTSSTATVSPTLSDGSLKLQIAPQSFKNYQLSVADIFPNLDTTNLKNYELRVRLKENINGLQFDWRPNALRDNAYFFLSQFCGAGTFTVGNYWGGRYNSNGTVSTSDWNEYIFRCKDGNVYVWLNQKIVFMSDIQTTTLPFSWVAYFSLNPGQYEFDYFRLYKL
jgi:hypothetical protein